MQKECILYKKEKNHVKCLACSHYCIIPENKTGICGVRKNINGKLFLLVYNKVVSHHIDPVEKKPLYHFLPGTNAYESKEAIDFISGYIDAMNIDLKSFSNEFYLKNCKAKLQPVLDTIKYAYEKGIWIEITTLIIPKENDSEKELESIAKFISSIDKNIPWHISRFFPIYKMSDKNFTPEKTLSKAYEIGKKYLNYVYIGNIQKENNTICPKCSKEVILRHNYITINKLIKGKCPYCSEKIAGVFE